MPVVVSGGMAGAEHIRAVFESTGCAAVMLARGALGNPWLFAQVLGDARREPSRAEILAEWEWVLDRAVEHLGPGARRPLSCAPSTPGTSSAWARGRRSRTRSSAPRPWPSSAPSSSASRNLF